MAADPKRGFRPDIEGLRAIAIGAVLLCHAGLGFAAGGFVGVDVFFVISGFLITRLLLGEVDRTRRLSLARFYARRVKRLLPLLAVVLAAVAALSLALFSPVRAGQVSQDILSSATYTANWHFAAQSVDYFAIGSQPSPVQHLWSLAIEEQFYLVWPVLLIAVTWLWRRRGGATRPVVLVALTAILIVSLVFNVGYTNSQPAAAYFSTFGRAWELALGAMLAALGDFRLPRLPAALLGWLGLGAIVYAVLTFSARTPFPGTAALIPTLGAAAMIAAGSAATPARWCSTGLLSTSPFRYVGRISYSWYLWHWPALIFAAAIWGTLSPLAGLAVVVASWVPTAISHHAVEEPFRRSKLLVAMPRRALVLAVGCTAISLGAAALLVRLQPKLSTAPIADVRGALALEAHTSLQQHAAAVRPNPLKAWADRSKMYYDGCLVGFAGTESHPCVYGTSRGQRTLVLFGDSHAMQFFPALQSIARRNGWRLLALAKAACTPAEVRIQSMDSYNEYSQCDAWRQRTLERIARVSRPATVVTASETDYTPYGEYGEELHGRAASEALEAGYVATLKRLRSAGLQTVVMKDPPPAPGEIPECVSENLDHLRTCAFPHERIWDREFEARAARRVPGAQLIDVTHEICPRTLCPAVIGNALVYRDHSHLTATFARTLTPWIERGLIQPGPGAPRARFEPSSLPVQGNGGTRTLSR